MEPQISATKKRPRGKPFSGAADQRTRQNMEKAAKDRPPTPRVEVEGTGLLADYRFVWANDRAHDDTPQRKALRKLPRKNPQAFVKTLADFEKAELSERPAERAAGTPRGTPEETPDLGTERCLRLIDELLGEFQSEKAR